MTRRYPMPRAAQPLIDRYGMPSRAWHEYLGGIEAATNALSILGAPVLVGSVDALELVEVGVYNLAISTGYESAGDGGGGTWEWRSGDYSDEVAADPYQGMYVAPSDRPSGANGAWVRLVSGEAYNAKWVGAGGSDDSAARIQSLADQVEDLGGGVIRIPTGSYIFETTLYLRQGVKFIGDGDSTVIYQRGDRAIDQVVATSIDDVALKGFKFIYDHATPSQSHQAMRLGSIQDSNFDDLHFVDYDTATGSGSFDGQTICYVNSDATVPGRRNHVFNVFRNWYVEGCRRGIVYDGTDGGSTWGPDQASGTYVRRSVISNCSAYNLQFRSVSFRGIEAIQWADTMRYYDCFFEMTDDSSVAIDLNTDGTNWKQIDRFSFYGLCLTSRAPTVSSVTGVRLGPGTFGMYFSGVIADLNWKANEIFRDVSAEGYWITATHPKVLLHKKLTQTNERGVATILATTTNVTVTHGLGRTPTSGEILVTPLSNINSGGTARTFWVSSAGATTFRINIDSSHPTLDFDFAWRSDMGVI